jgi:V8-like Glu-specific endopeptidase
VALLCRAEREQVPISGFPDASTLAREILQKIEAKDLDGHESVPTWDLATAVEACVALGKSEEALSWARRYVDQLSADAFELASTLRQLTQVWQLQTHSEPGARLLPLLNAALLKREGGNLTVDAQDFQSGPLDQLGGQLEKVLGKDGYATYKWYKTGLERCRAVACIEREDEQGFGTGFLIKGADLHSALGDELLLLTNAHVVSNDPSVKGALRPHEAMITFQVLNTEGGERKAFQVAQVLWTSPPHQLDASLLRLNTPVSGVESYPLAPELPVIDENDPQRIYIIGHPEGGTLSLSIHDNLLLDYENPILHYRTPTEGGSSGSPVFNQQWRLIALHHKGGKQLRRLNGKPGTYEANEGIWIQAISKAVATQLDY